MTKTPLTASLGVPSSFNFGTKKLSASHQSYQADSTAIGLYPLAIGKDISNSNTDKVGGKYSKRHKHLSYDPWVLYSQMASLPP